MMRNLTLELMKKHNVPLTRQNYLDIEYMGNPPEEIGGEIEASIPWEIKRAEEIALMAQMDFPFDASGCCPACGDATDFDSLLCDDCMDMVSDDPRTYRTSARPCQNADEYIAREEARHIELLWSSRNAFTVADREWFDELKIAYDDPCGLDLNAR